MRGGVPAPVDVLSQRPRNDCRTGGDLLARSQTRFSTTLSPGTAPRRSSLAYAHLALDHPDARAPLIGVYQKYRPNDRHRHVPGLHVQMAVTLPGGADDDVAPLQANQNPVSGTSNGHLGVRTHLYTRVVCQRDLQ